MKWGKNRAWIIGWRAFKAVATKRNHAHGAGFLSAQEIAKGVVPARRLAGALACASQQIGASGAQDKGKQDEIGDFLRRQHYLPHLSIERIMAIKRARPGFRRRGEQVSCPFRINDIDDRHNHRIPFKHFAKEAAQGNLDVLPQFGGAPIIFQLIQHKAFGVFQNMA